MSQNDCRSELVQRERRGRLSSSEQLALEAHVETCESCRVTRQVGHDFDNWSVVDSADAARLERMMQLSQRWVSKPHRLAKPSRTRWLLAAMSATIAAAAATVAVGNLTWNGTPPADGTTASAEAPSARAKVEHPSQPAAIVAETPEPPAAQTERDTRYAPVAIPSAEQLLQKANLARRNGDTKEAIRLFRRLQRDFPTSREAGLSLVALGTLLLEQGQASRALEQYTRYLEMGAGAALTAEALYGKGRALAQLGSVEQEQQTWRRLLSAFPKSPYAIHAKRRLGLVE